MASLDELLTRPQSKSNAAQMGKIILADKTAYVALIKMVLGKDELLAQKAAWPLGAVGYERPEWSKPYHRKLLEKLHHPCHNAIKRGITRLFEFMDVKPSEMSYALDTFIHLINDHKEAIAVRAFSMSCAYRIVQKEPELSGEFELILRNAMNSDIPALVARGRNLLKDMQKKGWIEKKS
jgi:hypothetical protein